MSYSGLYVGGIVALLNYLWFTAPISSRFQGVATGADWLQ